MNIVYGDLLKMALEGDFDVIVHGCNCYCAMGAGIAKAIKTHFPEAYTADCATARGDKDKLGTISTATIERFEHSITVVNGYTQFDYQGDGPLVDYDAVSRVMQEVKKRFSGNRIGYPKIGAGLAKGDWKQISKRIDQALVGETHTLVEYRV